MSLSLSFCNSQLLYADLDLSQEGRFFRLIRLDPGPWWETDVSGPLHEYFLDQAPPYRTLSCAWQNSDDNRDNAPSAATASTSVSAGTFTARWDDCGTRRNQSTSGLMPSATTRKMTTSARTKSS